MRRNILFYFILSLVSCFGLLSCSQEKKAEPEEIVLKWALWDYETTPYYKPLIKAFEAENLGIKIEPLDLGGTEYSTLLTRQLEGGISFIDVLMIKDMPAYVNLVEKNLLLDLTYYVESNGIDISQYSGAAQQVMIDDRLYQLPFRNDFWVIFYNKDTFKDNNIPFPTNDMTWDEFDDLARRVTFGTGSEKKFGCFFHTWRSMVQCPAILDGKQNMITPPYGFLKPFYERVLKLQNDGICMNYNQLKSTGTHYSTNFYNGKVAMMQMGTWFISLLEKQIQEGNASIKDWGIVKLPHNPDVKPGTTVGTLTGVAVSASSAKKEAACKFAAFLSGEKGASILARAGNCPSFMNDDTISILSRTYGFPKDKESKEALKTEQVYLEMPYTKKLPEVESILNKYHDDIMNSNCTIDEGIAMMSNDVEEVLKD